MLVNTAVLRQYLAMAMVRAVLYEYSCTLRTILVYCTYVLCYRYLGILTCHCSDRYLSQAKEIVPSMQKKSYRVWGSNP